MLIIEIALGVVLGLLVYHHGNAILRTLYQYWKKAFYAVKREKFCTTAPGNYFDEFVARRTIARG